MLGFSDPKDLNEFGGNAPENHLFLIFFSSKNKKIVFPEALFLLMVRFCVPLASCDQWDIQQQGLFEIHRYFQG